MNFGEIKKLVITEYDSRNLVSDVRYRALDQLDTYLKENVLKLWNDVSKFPIDKEQMKSDYANYLGKSLNGAESSMINEVYNQIKNRNVQLTDYSKLKK